MEPLYVKYFLSKWKIDPNKTITDFVIFYWASNVQIADKIMKFHYPKLTIMCVVDRTVSFFFQNTNVESDDYRSQGNI